MFKSIAAIPALLAFAGFHFLGAQSYQVKTDISVISGPDTLYSAWAGGLNNPQVSPLDLDNDGIMDLVAFDREDNRIVPFLNMGGPGQVDYRFAPEFVPKFPAGIGDMVLFRDFDGDGDMDIFSATPSSNIRVWKNTSGGPGSSLSFSLFKSEIYTKYSSRLWLYSARMDVPSIADLDLDGDLDILTFDVLGYQVEWHKNISVDSGWGLDSLEYVMQSYCYGHFYEDFANCSAFVNQAPCAPGNYPYEDPNQMSSPRHAGSTLLGLQLNNDGLPDLLVGDVSCTDLYALYNNGTNSIANFNLAESNFPTYDTAIDITLFPAGFHLDLDLDGNRDLLAAPNQVGTSADLDGLWMYRNTGADLQPVFHFQQRAFLQDEMIEVGTGSAPAFFDYNGDGLWDLLVANNAAFDTTYDGQTGFSLYENIGNQTKPAFSLVDDDYLALKTNPSFAYLKRIVPTLADLDNDGDDDLLIGQDDGMLTYFRNDEAAGLANFTFITANYASVDVGNASAPALYDFNSDGDFDLVVGNQKGYLWYYDNTGTPAAPTFTFKTDTLGFVKINDFTGMNYSLGYSRPFVVNMDADAGPELLVGGIEGTVALYDDVVGAPGLTFPNIGTLGSLDFGSYATPAAAWIDTTGNLTYLIGNQRGGLTLYGVPYVTGPVSRPDPSLPFGMDVFPNPSQGTFQISLIGAAAGEAGYLRVLNAIGQEVYGQKTLGTRPSLNLQHLPSGMYLLDYQSQNHKAARRIVIE